MRSDDVVDVVLRWAHTPGVRPVAKAVRNFVRSYPCVPVRRLAHRGRADWVRRLPARLRDELDLTVTPDTSLRVELGSGAYPTSGFVHVDFDRRARHLEYVAPVWRLPFGDGTVEHIRAIHVLEHVHPAQLQETLAEWRRVLRVGGAVQVHVPRADAVFRAFLEGNEELQWAMIGSGLFGMNGGPRTTSPHDFDLAVHKPDHKAIYDFKLLSQLLRDAGFVDIEDLTGEVDDRHTAGWRHLVPDMSLAVRARR